MNRRIPFRIFIAVVAAVTIGVALLPMTGDTDTTSAREFEHSIALEASPGMAALRAYRNPETGRLEVGPGPAQKTFVPDPELQNALRRDSDGLVETHHANGAVSVDLQGRFQSVTVLRKDRDGKRYVCTTDVDDTEKALHEHKAEVEK